MLELEPPQKVDMDVEPELELEVEPETKVVPQPEPCLAPTLTPEAEQDSHVEAYCEDPEKQDRTESLHSCTAELTQQNASRGTMTLISNSLNSTCKEVSIGKEVSSGGWVRVGSMAGNGCLWDRCLFSFQLKLFSRRMNC